VHRNLRGEDIVAVLDELTAIRGALARIRADNRPEMILKAVKAWCEESGTRALYIASGSPWQNRIVESFSGRLRDELLSSFDTLAGRRPPGSPCPARARPAVGGNGCDESDPVNPYSDNVDQPRQSSQSFQTHRSFQQRTQGRTKLFFRVDCHSAIRTQVRVNLNMTKCA
jgi:transposase InsO family protein